MKIEIGSIVKSLDFPGIPDHYYTGVVTKIIQDMIYITPIRKVVSGNEVHCSNEEIRFPKQGALSMDCFGPRVYILDQNANGWWALAEEENDDI
jgi:hypothetical protein